MKLQYEYIVSVGMYMRYLISLLFTDIFRIFYSLPSCTLGSEVFHDILPLHFYTNQ